MALASRAEGEASVEDAGTDRSEFDTEKLASKESQVSSFTDFDPSPRKGSRHIIARIHGWLNRAQARVLVALEQLPLRYPIVRQFMIDRHKRAFSRLLVAANARPADICIVGGALFPRTLIVLRELLPDAHITIIDASLDSLDEARAHMGALDDHTSFQHDIFDPRRTTSFDAVVIPVGYVGDREVFYRAPTSLTFLHDWIWRVRGDGGTIVSWLLMKRLNFVHGRASEVAASPSCVSTDGCPTA